MGQKPEEEGRRIAFIGLGVMGSAMAGHLARAGHFVTGYDRNPGAGEDLTRAASAAQAVVGAEVVITMLPDGEVVARVAQEIADALSPGALFIDSSSSEPWITQSTAAHLARSGVRMVDAPVSGAEWGAKAAELVFMVGGSDVDVAEAHPLLRVMGRSVYHVGPIGAGHVMKSVNNVITAATVVTTAEAMEVGRAWGLDPLAMVDVLDESTGGSWWSATRLRQDVLNGAFADRFKLGLMQKDVSIACELAGRRHLTPEILARTLDLWSEAKTELGPERPVTEMARYTAERIRPRE
jgi:3-hydroxyisobutyrate dehydrogenase